MVVAASSPLLTALLRENPARHAVLLLPHLSFSLLSRLVDFLYHRLPGLPPELAATAECLGIPVPPRPAPRPGASEEQEVPCWTRSQPANNNLGLTPRPATTAKLSPRPVPAPKLPGWSQQQMCQAIECVVSQRMRFTQASTKFGIPKVLSSALQNSYSYCW